MDILKKLNQEYTIIEDLGQPGQHAHIFKLLNNKNIPFILKRQFLTLQMFQKDYREIIALKLVDELMKQTNSPHFVQLHSYFASPLFHPPSPIRHPRIHPLDRAKPVLAIYMLQEHCQSTVEDWLKNIIDQKQWLPNRFVFSLLVQMISAILSLQIYGNMYHNDVHFGNIFRQDVSPNICFVYKCRGNMGWSSDSFGTAIKIGDFGLVQEAHQQQQQFFNNKKKFKKTNMMKQLASDEIHHLRHYSNIHNQQRDIMSLLLNWLYYAPSLKGGLTHEMTRYIKILLIKFMQLTTITTTVTKKRNFQISTLKKDLTIEDLMQFFNKEFHDFPYLKQICKKNEVSYKNWRPYLLISSSSSIARPHIISLFTDNDHIVQSKLIQQKIQEESEMLSLYQSLSTQSPIYVQNCNLNQPFLL